MGGQVTIVSSGENLGVTLGINSLDVTTSQRVDTTPPTTWEDKVDTYGRGYNFPSPTGQSTSFRTRDDAWVESNYFGDTIRKAESLKALNTLSSDPSQLNYNNAFGNKNRWTLEDGNVPSSQGQILVDHFTGLAFYFPESLASGSTSDIWDDVIDAAAASSQGGYSDWFIPNWNILNSIFLYTTAEGGSDRLPDELLTVSGYTTDLDRRLWSSTTNLGATTKADVLFLRRTNNAHVAVTKTTVGTVYYPIYCRKYY